VPYIKRWKANQFLYQSQVYLDEKIGSSPELIGEGIRKARVAYLLNPNDPQSYQNYLDLLFLEDPAKALNLWTKLVDNSENGIQLGNSILTKSLTCLQKEDISLETKVFIGKNAIQQFQYLTEIETWNAQPKNLLMGAEILAETGNHQEALQVVDKVIEKFPEHPEAVFLLTRIAVHLQDQVPACSPGQSLGTIIKPKKRGRFGSNSSHDSTQFPSTSCSSELRPLHSATDR
jgi:tetratricopeptide (TPR) repeat protein